MSKIQFGAKVEPARNNPYALAQQPAASAPERVDRATLRQALHAMKRCQRESGGSRWAPWIAKVEAALDAGDDRD